MKDLATALFWLLVVLLGVRFVRPLYWACVRAPLRGIVDRLDEHLRPLVGAPANAALWVTATVIAWAALRWPGAGPWAQPMSPRTQPMSLLQVSAALLALLLFSANFYKDVAKGDPKRETYLGRELDTFLINHSWTTAALSQRAFHYLAGTLFVAPAALTVATGTLAGHDVTALLRAAWTAAFGIVGGLGIANVLTVLSRSLVRFNRPAWLKILIEQDVQRGFTRRVRAETRDVVNSSGDLQDVVRRAVRSASALPPEEAKTYLVETVFSRQWRERRRKVAKRTDGAGRSGAYVMDLAQWRGTIRALREAEMPPETAGLVISGLLGTARDVDRTYTAEDQGDEALAAGVLAPEGRLPEADAGGLTGIRHHESTPELLALPAAIVRDVVAHYFPPGQASRCSDQQLRQLVETAGALRHLPTRDWALRQVFDAALLESVVRRDPSELLSADALSRITGLAYEPGRSTEPSSKPYRSAQEILQDSALHAVTRHSTMTTPNHKALLAMLPWQHTLVAFLSFVIDDRHRPLTDDINSLRLFATRLGPVRWKVHDADSDDELLATVTPLATAVDGLARHDPLDPDWIIRQLRRPAGPAMVEAYRSHTDQGGARHISLEQALVARYLAGHTSWFSEAPNAPSPPREPWRREADLRAVRSAGALLREVDSEISHHFDSHFLDLLHEERESER